MYTIDISLTNVTALKIKNADYCCTTIGISKSEALKLLQNIDLTKKSGTIKKNIKSNICIYENGKNINFGDIEIEKQKFHQHKRPISINNIDINKIVSNKVSFDEKVSKYFNDYKDARK